MARNDPEKLAQALRANLRRRKAGPAAATPPQLQPPEPPVEKPQPPEG